MLGIGKKRGRKKKGEDATTEPVEPVAASATEQPTEPVAAIGAVEPVTSPLPVTETPIAPTSFEAPMADQHDGAAQPTRTPRGQFRSWVTYTDRGYSRMVDEENKNLVVQFAVRPPADVLTALKDGGFRFKPDYHGQKNAWVRLNDFEGRVQVEAMEKLFKAIVPGQDVPDR